MDEKPKEKTTYLKCLIHEIEKVTVVWYAGILAALGAVAGIYGIWSVSNGIVNFISKLWDEITITLGVIPWWCYLIAGIIAAPFVYAAIKCAVIRITRPTIKRFGGVLFVSGIVFVALSLIIGIGANMQETPNQITVGIITGSIIAIVGELIYLDW
jgi:hypothetical protein